VDRGVQPSDPSQRGIGEAHHFANEPRNLEWPVFGAVGLT
jgi:hypothetical protein